MTPFPRAVGRALRALAGALAGAALALLATAPAARAQPGAGPGAPGASATVTGLPPEVVQALQRARVPADALSVVIEEAGSAAPHRLQWNADVPRNPASVAKLLTTYAALDRLGPAWTWTTPVWLTGPVKDGVLDGSVVIKGSGDPKLVIERLWLLMRRLQQLGVQEIRGDIVLDRSAFRPDTAGPGDFDGEAHRPYNVRADALLLNYRAQVFTFTPDATRGVARVGVEPPLDGVATDTTVPLASGPCGDWREGLKATLNDPQRMAFAGRYPTSCGELNWPLAYADPARYDARLLAALWRTAGGRLGGEVREGTAPAGAPQIELQSPALSEVVREINKFSNNVMAQQVFLTLGLLARGEGSPEAARGAMREWISQRLGDEGADVVIDNGSGLSRDTRMTARWLARLLQRAWSGPVMPELMASLPVTGVDGTLRRARSAPGRAHLKTGTLNGVTALAGYVLSDTGRRYVLVAMINHPQAGAARPALDALVQWTLTDRP
jgi:serine-type D-Ala-D-Ala carboxypeptidase/endopeptidase (penicillin-binding protein 4)